MSQLNPELDHLLRRAGFGAGPMDVDAFGDKSMSAAVSSLVDFEGQPDDVDARIGRSDHAPVNTNGGFTPDVDIEDARQRWLFRMVHTRRPLQEKMALFWHNHFATAYSKLVADSGATQAAKMLAAKPGVLRGPQGQLELLRQYALGNFRDLLLNIAQDAATLIWLDGKSNTREKPQENFGREIMELFTVGVGNYAESDVYAAARVFTGWNLRQSEAYKSADANSYQEFVYNADQHEPTAKTFSFPIYSNGSGTIPERSPAAGMQDGIDLVTALAFNPNTARRLAGKLWNFFISEILPPDPRFIDSTAAVYLQNGTEMKPVMRSILTSQWFNDPAIRNTRYSWPAEFVARAIKEVGWQGFTLDKARTPLANMGQLLFEPPNVGGWPLGANWFSTSTMLARTNFAAALVTTQKDALAAMPEPDSRTPQALLAALLTRLTTAPLDAAPQQSLTSYLVAGGPWTGSASQLNTRAAGLARLLVGSSEYQLV